MSGSIVRWGAAAPMLVLALGAAAPACAQSGMLEAGGVAEGTVAGAESPTTIEVRAAPGQTLQLDAIPGARAVDGLDLMLKVTDARGEVVGQDDDGGGNLNPRVTFTSEAGGRYRAEVGVIGQGGAFTLLARESVIVPEVTTALTLSGGKAEQALSFPENNNALFTFSGRRGEAWSITLVAQEPAGEDAADPMIELFPGDGTGKEALFSDDDSGGGLNSRIVAELPEDGTYTVRVSSLSSKGLARLGVAKMTLRPASVGNLAYGTPTTVTFAQDTPFVVGESTRRLVPYALFRLPASPAPRAMAGEMIVIRATAEGGLDPYLEVGLDTPLGFATVLSNDDANELNAAVTLDPAKFASDDANWWNQLRIRVSAPVGATGDIQVSAERTTN
jgi:hypothetical protein